MGKKIIIVGGGPAGYVAAIRAAQLGAEVDLVEKDALGGTCLNIGCIPTKVLLSISDFYHKAHTGAVAGVKSTAELDWQEAQAHKDAVVAQLTGGVAWLLRNHGIRVHTGTAALKPGLQVQVGDETLSGDAVLLALGSVCGELAFPGNNLEGILYSTEALSLKEPPRSVLIVGGGVIGVEFATMFAQVGAEVTIVEMMPEILPGIDEEIAEFLHKKLEADEVSVLVDSWLESVELYDESDVGNDVENAVKNNADAGVETSAEIGVETDVENNADAGVETSAEIGVENAVKNNADAGVETDVETSADTGRMLLASILCKDGLQKIKAEKILIATGRKPNTGGLGLESLGVKMDRGAILVDENLQTNIPGLYAPGDCNGKLMLAHAAMSQGITAVEHIMGVSKSQKDHIPACVYTSPEIATVGKTEQELQAQGIPYVTGRFSLTGNGKAIIEGEDGFIKILADPEYGEVLGVHMIGPKVTEMIGEAVLCMNMEGTAEELASTVHAHPTVSESVWEAALSISGMGIHSISSLP